MYSMYVNIQKEARCKLKAQWQKDSNISHIFNSKETKYLNEKWCWRPVYLYTLKLNINLNSTAKLNIVLNLFFFICIICVIVILPNEIIIHL